MRSAAKFKDQNLMLQERLANAYEEIKQLRQYVRDIFEQQEENIVALSFDKDSEKKTGAGMSETSLKGGSAIVTDATGSVKANTSQLNLTFHPLSKQFSSTEAELVSKNAKTGSKKRDLRAISNIHQLYQDLFITDMKDEIASASNEVIKLR